MLAVIDDLLDELEIDEATATQAQRRKAETRLAAADAAIKRFARLAIELVEDDAATLAGTWSHRLMLPEIPVVDVASVVASGTTLTEGTDWHLVGDTLVRGSAPTILERDEIEVSAPAPTMHWGGPAATIVVTYDHGWETIPADLVQMCVSVAARNWDNPSGVSAESILGYSVTYGGAGMVGPSMLTREERATLRDLRNRWVRAVNP